MAENTDPTLQKFIQDVATRWPENARLAYAKVLKRAGVWSGEPSGKFDTKYLDALTKLEDKLLQQRSLDKLVGTNVAESRDSMLANLMSSGDGGGGSKRVPSRSVSYDRPEIGTTQAITNAAYQNLMGRDASPAEIKAIHAKYLKFAAKNPTSSSSSMAVVDETGAVTVNQSTSVSTGTSERDFIDNLVSGNAEAKAYNAASTYLDGMMEEMSRFAGGK